MAVDPVLPLAQRLLDCLCQALADTTAGPPCRCALYPGTPPADECCDCGTPEDGPANGQASVHIGTQYPSTDFPNPDAAPVGRCVGQAPWAAQLVMTVYRCVHTQAEDGTPPTAEEVAEDAAMLSETAAAMTAAAVCCFAESLSDDPEDDDLVHFGAVEPVGPLGGCAGRRMTVTVAYDICCPTDESPSPPGSPS